MQLVNVIRDVAEDLDLGRSYLPREDLERFGYGSDELRRRVFDDRFRALLAFEAERARGYFREAEPLFDSILPESRYCPVLLRSFYSRILDRIEARGWNVFEGRVRLPVWEKLYLAAKLWRSAARGKRGALRPRSS
jgi:phytoene synthase